MQVISVGVNHASAPVEVREKLALVGEQIPAALAQVSGYVPEAAILSTCNRMEVYALVADASSGAEALKSYMSEFHKLSPKDFEPHLYIYRNEEAARHLFAVASGIDSMILGETEILGQVREALAEASNVESIGTTLSRLFHWALRTGRKARVETAISRNAVSVSYAAVTKARDIFGGLSHCRVLVISAGDAGKLTAKTLRDSGAGELAVANRTYSRALALAEELGGRPITFESISEALAEFDIVISATSSTSYVLSKGMVVRAMQQRDGKPLFLIDIAVPRDVDPQVGLINNVHLFDIDDLQAVSLTSLEERKKSVPQVCAIIDEEAKNFMHWLRSLETIPVIKALQGKAERIRKLELTKSLAKLRHLTDDDRQHIESLSKAITKKLLHDPLVSIRSKGQSKGYIDAARQLFHLSEE